jgi:hypothetical protein
MTRTNRMPVYFLKSGAAHNVRGVQSLGALLAFEFHRIALVQGLVPVLLDGGEVHEDILPSRTLDKPISFGTVKPLHHAIFLQANFLSSLYQPSPALLEDTTSGRSARKRRYSKSWVTWSALRAVKQLHQFGLPSVRTMNFCSSLLMLWQELESSARKICLGNHTIETVECILREAAEKGVG